MKKNKVFGMIRDNDMKIFTQKITYLLNDGWNLHGDSIVIMADGRLIYIQSVVK